MLFARAGRHHLSRLRPAGGRASHRRCCLPVVAAGAAGGNVLLHYRLCGGALGAEADQSAWLASLLEEGYSRIQVGTAVSSARGTKRCRALAADAQGVGAA